MLKPPTCYGLATGKLVYSILALTKTKQYCTICYSEIGTVMFSAAETTEPYYPHISSATRLSSIFFILIYTLIKITNTFQCYYTAKFHFVFSSSVF